MTLDEAILHAKEKAKEHERKLKIYENINEDRPLFREEEMACKLCAEEHRQLAEWLKELQQLRKQTRWTPVSGGLPKENEVVIASTRYSVYPEAKYTKECDWEWAYESGSDYWVKLEGVTAWMPLPEPYKAERNGKE